MTNSQDWEKLQELFHLAAEAPEETREQVLSEACADPNLRKRVLDILLASAKEREAVAEPIHELNARIGPYRLLRHLGTGGIGSVYLVERMIGGSPHRSALKMLARHAAGPLFLERFQREQHILASLDHPNITRMTDAGLDEDGQPYLVMEYVHGRHLDTHANMRQLGLEQRLRLFLQVCDAVAYAHRNLIVHLDLKPSNILVTEDGVVKLLDFGTSKLIQPDSLLTTTILATPAYASPEQLRNEAVTTACDIYSLGAILFELLSGRRPGGKSSVAVMVERAMREQEPEPLTDAVSDEAAAQLGTTGVRLRQLLRGDLATITSKCLRARPQERYLSVDALAEDLQRYLEGRPVLATRQTILYRSAKFVRRHWKAVTVSGVAALLLAGSITYAVARQELLLRDARRAIELQAFMEQLFRLTKTNYNGKPAVTVPEFLQLGTRLLPQMMSDPADQRAGQILLAQSMYSDEDFAEAEATLQPVLADARAHGDFAALAEAEGLSAQVALKLGKYKQYFERSAEALKYADDPGVSPSARVWIKIIYTEPRYEFGLTTPADVAIQHDAMLEAQSPGVPASELGYAKLVYTLVGGSRIPLAERLKLAREGVDLFRSRPFTVCETARAELTLGFLQSQAQDPAASLATYRDSQTNFVQCSGQDSPEALTAAAGVGGAMFFAGQPENAVPLLESTTQKMLALFGPGDPRLIPALAPLAGAYSATGRFKQAEDTSLRVLPLSVTLKNHRELVTGLCHLNLARALEGEGRYAEALQHAELAEKAYAAESDRTPMVIANGQNAHQLSLDLKVKQNLPRK